MNAFTRRQAALEAIEAVQKGARALDIETEVIDFKEETGTVAKGGRQSISATHEPAAEQLTNEAACLANSPNGGVLVVGVNDKAAGPAAFVGTYLDTVWLRGRIHALTKPNLAIDEIEELTVEGQRIYMINVAPALQETWAGGKLRARFGTDCRELSGDQAREFLEQRRKYDWTSEASGMRFSAATPAALASARAHYEAKQGTAPASDLALIKRLGVTLDDSDDPELNHAGALLFCEFEPTNEQLDIIVTDVEGTPSRDRLIAAAPLLPAFDQAWALLERNFPATPVVVGAQRREIRRIPDAASRESLINAIMHRDYRLPRSSIVTTVIGDPSTVLKVRSPGGFPPGVSGDRLLASPSKPRNPTLANALRTLGLAEREGVGIATMFRSMLRDGHPEPEITEEGGDVICRLAGGDPDLAVRGFFDSLTAHDRQLGEDVRAHIAIYELLRATPLRPERLLISAQCTFDEARDILRKLAGAGSIEPLVPQSLSYRLSDRAREQLRNRISYKTRKTLDQQWELIEAYLDVHDAIGREEAAQLLGVKPPRAATILSQLYNKHGRIKPVGKPLGRGVRYRLA